MQLVLPAMERELSRVFKARRRHVAGSYAVFLTSQYQKDQLIAFVKEKFRDVDTLVTSGTIRKCKKFIESHRASSGKEEKEISALF